MSAKRGSVGLALDRAADSIERGSKDPFGGRQSNRVLIDVEILQGRMDLDQMRYEEKFCQHRDVGFVYKKAHTEVLPDDATLTQRACGDVCTCCEDKVCAICTQQDLDAIGSNALARATVANPRLSVICGVLVKVYDLFMPPELAQELGFDFARA